MASCMMYIPSDVFLSVGDGIPYYYMCTFGTFTSPCTGVGTRGAGGASAPLLLNEGGQSPLLFVMVVAQ